MSRLRAWIRHLFRDRRDDDPDRPDWQALVDAVDFAASIASGYNVEHVIRHRSHARMIADVYATSARLGAVDAELFALEYALDLYPDDLFGRRDATRRYDYLFRDRTIQPDPTP